MSELAKRIMDIWNRGGTGKPPGEIIAAEIAPLERVVRAADSLFARWEAEWPDKAEGPVSAPFAAAVRAYRKTKEPPKPAVCGTETTPNRMTMTAKVLPPGACSKCMGTGISSTDLSCGLASGMATYRVCDCIRAELSALRAEVERMKR